MASSSSSGGMSNMSRLMASSRLSSFHPKVPQVYTAPPSHIARGDFGIKRPLPTRHIPLGKIRYVGIADMDTKYRQTDWREQEREVLMLKRFSELNVKLTPPGQGRDASTPRPGSLGPKLSTVYDHSLQRIVPTDYDELPDGDFKKFLQAEARLGRGPVYAGNWQDHATLSTMAGHTDHPEIQYNYRTMSEKQFEKYLGQVREKREAFKDYLANRAALLARTRVKRLYEKQRAKMVEEAEKAESIGATIVPIPKPVRVGDLPTPKRSEVESESSFQVDLWDEARLVDASKEPWESWLKSQKTSPLRLADSAELPLQSSPNGGFEIPTPLHIHGGLQYSQPDSITTQLLCDSLPARVLGSADEAGSRNPRKPRRAVANTSTLNKSVAIGGRIATMERIFSNAARPIDISGNDPTQGNIRVKVISATIEKEKTYTVTPETLRFEPPNDSRLPPQYGNTVLTVRATQDADERSVAKGVPGSIEWIAQINGRYRTSGQGQGPPLDYADKDSMMIYNSRRALDEESDRDRLRQFSPGEQMRRERKDRLKQPSSSSSRNVERLWSAMTNPQAPRTIAKRSKVSAYQPRPPPRPEGRQTAIDGEADVKPEDGRD